MRFFHLSDLHLGKRLHEQSLLEDQRAVLETILTLVAHHRPDAVVLAGDIYDKPVPSAEAVTLFDSFLSRLAGLGLPVLLISGNHDSAERLAFGARLLAESRVYVSPVYDGALTPMTLRDDYGPVDFWLLPFVKPTHVRAAFPEEPITDTDSALRAAIAHLPLDPARRNVLVAHQFVTGSSRSESEEISVGGSDNVDAAAFAPFDYVALGHLHRPQNCGSRIRYSGSPLKYSFSEEKDEKSVTLVELDQDGKATLTLLPLPPRRDLKTIRGTYRQLTLRSFYEGTDLPQSYLRVVLTDEEDIPDAAARLRVIYPGLLKLEYDNARTRAGFQIEDGGDVETKSPLELLEELYRLQHDRPLAGEQEALAKALIRQTWEEVDPA